MKAVLYGGGWVREIFDLVKLVQLRLLNLIKIKLFATNPALLTSDLFAGAEATFGLRVVSEAAGGSLRLLHKEPGTFPVILRKVL